MKRIPAALLALTAVIAVSAQNPIINTQFTADPTARVFGDRIYLYPSHDIPSPIERLREWFCMEDYHVFSSADLVNWQDHGMIITQNRVPWVEKDSYAMWAPDCVERDGTYYFYFPSQPRGEKGFGIGVAMAQAPEGPFMPMFRPIEGIHGIDPCVLVDYDEPGQPAYIYWSGRGLNVAELAPDMMSLASEPKLIEGLPEGFKEGPFAFRRGDIYYLTFPWVRNNTETLAYAVSRSPMGPFEFKGVIMDESPTGCWTNHHSIVEYRGQWYLFYHHNDYSPSFDKNRSTRIDSLFFEPDGSIRKVIPTLRGVGVSDACSRIQIDRYSAISPRGAKVDYLDRSVPFEGWSADLDRKGAWVRYDRVDFGAGDVRTVTLRALAPRGATVRIAAGDTTLATVSIPACSSWSEYRVDLEHVPSGLQDLTVTLTRGAARIDWVGFGALPWSQGAFETGRYRNLLREIGHSDDEIDGKLTAVFDSLFRGPNRVYFEVGDSMAYVSDVKNKDVRTEGMSYGMMAAVQFGEKDMFDRLWRWSKKYMQHSSGPRKGYFAWSCSLDGRPNAHGAASDGELYFVTSLIFASNLWGDSTGIDYGAEARHILDCSMAKAGMDHAAPLINLEHKLITFTPDAWGGRFTDPSYHVPAFYEVWAKWAGDGRSEFWRQCARASREYLHKCVHPTTGLTSDYTNYDGSLLGGRRVLGDAFRFDSWRVPMNIALDYSWSCADAPWQRGYADRVQDFLYSEGIDDFVDQYNVDGTPVSEVLGAGEHKALRHSLGLVATSAAASLAATKDRSREFVERLWSAPHAPYADGYFDAYYDGFLRLFSLMHLSGRYRIIPPRDIGA